MNDRDCIILLRNRQLQELRNYENYEFSATLAFLHNAKEGEADAVVQRCSVATMPKSLFLILKAEFHTSIFLRTCNFFPRSPFLQNNCTRLLPKSNYFWNYLAGAYFGPYQTSMMELFAKNG